MRGFPKTIRYRVALIGGLTIFIVLLAASVFIFTHVPLAYILPESMRAVVIRATPAREIMSPFRYTFNANGTLYEAGVMDMSSSPYFWLNSGGHLSIKDGVGMTNQGPLKIGMFWQLLYAKSNSLDTGKGQFPQNLFRLFTRSKWDNFSQEVRFQITNVNMTETPNRDGWSGVFLVSRYHDSDNLYYAGIRMDGTAVIKKKYKGVYTTLAQRDILPASETYDRENNPNLIPEDTWMRLEMRTVTLPDGSVTIDLAFDQEDDNSYEPLLSTTDTSNAISGPAYAGIRGDYFDFYIDDYTLKNTEHEVSPKK